MYLDKKPYKGIIHGTSCAIDGTPYDIYYIPKPTLLQKMYYCNYHSSFYVGVKQPPNVTTISERVLDFICNSRKPELPSPNIRRRRTTIIDAFNITYSLKKQKDYDTIFTRPYRKTYPEM